MKEIFEQLKILLKGKWSGEGFAKFPTIEDTAYIEDTEFKPDEFKDSILFTQKSFYKNATGKNGHTVFWDAGFIILKEDHILLHSVQVGGRIEQFSLASLNGNIFTFDSTHIHVDPKTMRSQRVFAIAEDSIHYELNMATHQEPHFQNHLKATLIRVK